MNSLYCLSFNFFRFRLISKKQKTRALEILKKRSIEEKNNNPQMTPHRLRTFNNKILRTGQYLRLIVSKSNTH